MSADAMGIDNSLPSPETADFNLSEEELVKGEQAANDYLTTLKPGEGRRSAEEALETLAAVISGGVCGGRRFPWHQVRAYHGALALSMAKERGAPAHVEALLCRHDETRKFQQVPEAYSTKHIQKMKTSLRRVIEHSAELGFISEDQMSLAIAEKNGSAKTRRPSRDRRVSESEVRALVAACEMDGSIASSRDGLMLGLAYHGELKTVDLVGLNLDDLNFSSRSGQVTIRVKPSGAKRARRVALGNQELIALEDWLEARGRDEGPLFCPIVRGRIEIKRMSAAEVREFCESWAEQAGVLPFAPNDLARSAQEAEAERRRLAKLRRRSSEKDASEPSALFGDAPEEDEPDTLISFPYDTRVGA